MAIDSLYGKQQMSELTESEMDVANSGPAIFSNRFLAAVGPWGVRLTFAELGMNQNPAFRTAVIMTIEDGVALSELLQKLIKEHLDTKVDQAE